MNEEQKQAENRTLWYTWQDFCHWRGFSSVKWRAEN